MVTLLGITSFGGIFILCLLFIILMIVSAKRSQICVDDDKAIEIFKIIEALREVCPVGSSRGWTLVANHCSVRCWRKTFSFKFFGCSLPIYSCCTRLNASSVFVLNVIADVTTWPEWDPAIHHQPLQAEISDDDELHGDSYMQCDQLVAMTVGKDPKPGILMHRFGNLEENGVGWIFLWHLSQLDWYFFLAQPLETLGGVESGHCLLTMISGKNSYMIPKNDVALQLATKLRNLKDAISRSRLQIRPFLLVSSASNLNNPHLPTIQSALTDLSSTPCVLLQPSPVSDEANKTDSKKDTVLCLVPFSTSKMISLKNIKGFVLVSKPASRKLKETEHSDKGRVRKRHKSHVRNIQEVESKDDTKNSKLFSCIEHDLSTMPTVTVTRPEDESPAPREKSLFGNLFNRARRLSDSALSDKESSSQADKSSSKKVPVQQFRARSSSTGSRFEKKHCQDRTSNDKESGLLGNLLAKAKKLSVSSSNVNSAPHLLKEEACTSRVQQSTASTENFREKSQITELLPEKKEHNENMDDLTSASKSGSKSYEEMGAKCISILLSEVNHALVTAVHVPNSESKCAPGKWIHYNGNKELTTLMKLQETTTQQTISYLSHGKINSSTSAIWDIVSNPLSRFVYDESVKKINVLRKLPNEQKIVCRYHEMISLLKKEVQDFCILQTPHKEKTKVILGYQSIESSLCPQQDDIFRGMVLPSGWIIQPTGKGKKCCLVTHLEQLLIPFPESQIVDEMGIIQSQCIPNIKRYLTSKPF